MHVGMRGSCVAAVPLRVTPITIGWIKEWSDKRVKRSCSVASTKKAVQNYRERSIMKWSWIPTPNKSSAKHPQPPKIPWVNQLRISRLPNIRSRQRFLALIDPVFSLFIVQLPRNTPEQSASRYQTPVSVRLLRLCILQSYSPVASSQWFPGE